MTPYDELEETVARMPRAFLLTAHPGPPARASLVELAHDKRLDFAPGEVRRVEHQRSATTGTRYHPVHLEDGRQFALTGFGFAFAPAFHSTGPLPDCPATASFADYHRLFRHLSHLVSDHHEGHLQEALQCLMILLAFLDGARALGLEVGEEECALEPLLKKLEAQGAL